MSAGKRVGARRAEKPKKFSTPALVHALGITACVIAWGYLVYAAIDFGTTARSGETAAWWLLGLAALGAVACLFVGLMLVARMMRLLGVGAAPAEVAAPEVPRAPEPSERSSSGPAMPATPAVPGRRRATPGGRRAAR